MTVEQSVVATAVHAWSTEIERLDKFFSPLTDEQLQKAIAPGKNRVIYLWGHLIAVHDRMLPLLGIGPRLHPELDAPFLTEADGSVEPSLSAAELKRLWDEVHGRLQTAFNTFTPAEWADRHTSVSAEDFAADPLRNRLAVLLSRTTHASYHRGQCVLAGK
jgi:hypothetical protein